MVLASGSRDETQDREPLDLPTVMTPAMVRVARILEKSVEWMGNERMGRRIDLKENCRHGKNPQASHLQITGRSLDTNNSK